jgi:glycerophosphoryl diester phosphodiesterase
MTLSSLSAQAVVPGVLRVLRRTWPQLVAVDLLAKAAGFLVVTPVATFLLRLFAERRGSAVLTDEAILWFFLSPLGLAALVVVGAVALWIFFIEHGAMLAIAHAASAGRGVTSLWAYGVIVRRGAAILRLTATLILRLLALASPFLGLMAAVYLTLLTEFDINYYLSVRPPVFWITGALIALLAVALLVTVGAMLVRWLLALPVLLFERRGVRRAFRASGALTTGRRRAIALWLLVWAVTSFVVTAVLTAAIGAAGRLLIPVQSESLEVVALAVGLVMTGSVLLNLVISVAVASLLGVLVERLYVACGGTGLAPDVLEKRPDARAGQARLRLGAIAGGLVVASVAAAAIATWVLSTLRVEDTTEITAHRGSSAAAPENTLAAVEQAIADRADWVEIDVQELADGTVVVMHDRDLKRLGRVNLGVAGSTYAELREVDVGSWFGPAFADQRIPTLEQVLDRCRGRARVNIELKYYGSVGTLAERVIRIVEERGMASDVVLMSLKHEAVRQAKALRPDWTVGVLTAVALGNLARLDADFLAVNASLATRSFIRSVHRRGRAVHVWTVNDPLQMSVLASRGVDNIITDVPAVGRTVLEERAEMTAVERLLVEVGAWVGIVPPAAEAPREPGD